MRRSCLLLICLLFSSAVFAVDNWAFTTPAQEQEFQQTLRQLRCPKCQNNSIADSTAPIAADMRQKVYELVREGKTRTQIIDYMVARYGNFVNYDPPVLPDTLILWLLPLLFVAAAVIVIVGHVRRSQRDSDATVINPSSSPARTMRAPVGGGVVLVGVVGAMAVSVVVYLSTTDLTSLWLWNRAQRQYPQLEKRVLTPHAKPLSAQDIAIFELGLRTRLAKQPTDLEGWRMLGRIGIVRGQNEIAIDAFAHAVALVPDNAEVSMDYADVLVHSDEMAMVRQGVLLLKTLPKKGVDNLRLVGLQQYAENRLKEE